MNYVSFNSWLWNDHRYFGEYSLPFLLLYRSSPTPNYLSIVIAIYKTTAWEVNQTHCSSYKAPGLHSVVLFKVAKAHDHLANCKDCFEGSLCKPFNRRVLVTLFWKEKERDASFDLSSLLVYSIFWSLSFFCILVIIYCCHGADLIASVLASLKLECK